MFELLNLLSLFRGLGWRYLACTCARYVIEQGTSTQINTKQTNKQTNKQHCIINVDGAVFDTIVSTRKHKSVKSHITNHKSQANHPTSLEFEPSVTWHCMTFSVQEFKYVCDNCITSKDGCSSYCTTHLLLCIKPWTFLGYIISSMRRSW